ncbi:MAG: phosphoglucosamine mutase [archaeon]
MGKLFGTNGVRGIINQDLSLETLGLVAKSSAFFLGKKIAVGRDARTTSPMIRDNIVSALVSIGCNVYDMGILPTPSLQYMTKKLGLDGGIMVTASHNPPEFNGVKVIASDGVEVPRELEDKIEELYDRGGPPLSDWNQIGKIKEIDVIDEYIDDLTGKVDSDLIKKAQIRVALDTGNGVSALTAPKVASMIGCKVFTVNTQLDGRFPRRGSEPTPENLQALKDLIQSTQSDYGIGFDGDGDRSIIMDETGTAVWGDKSLCLVADWYLKKNPGETVVTALSSSMGIEEVAESHDAKVHWTKVGSVDVSRAMVENGYKIGGEENGGIMYGPFHPVRDGTMVTALLAQILSEEKGPLSELISEQPGFYKGKDNIICPNQVKEQVLEELVALVDAPQIDTRDGVKLTYANGDWILIRPSGTEPKFRIYAESKDEVKLDELIQKHKELVERIIQGTT